MLNRATPELLKGVFDAALRKYLNRFLNIPPAKLPKPKSSEENNNNTNNINNNSVVSSSSTFDDDAKTSLKELSAVLDKQQQINQAGQLVADYIYNGGNPNLLLAAMGNLLLREDRNFHSIQMLEAAFRQYSLKPSEDNADNEHVNILVAAARYLAAHAPTMPSQGRTYQIPINSIMENVYLKNNNVVAFPSSYHCYICEVISTRSYFRADS